MPRIPRSQVQAQLHRIAGIVGEHTEGIGQRAIAQEYFTQFRTRIAGRTLQRRLEQLVSRGTIIPRGEARGTVYEPVNAETGTRPADGYLPITAEATKGRALVRLPISRRQPVGYNPDWLFAYQPGDTWYLPKKMRTHLGEVGKTPDDNRPAGTFARDVLGRLLIDLHGRRADWRATHTHGWTR